MSFDFNRKISGKLATRLVGSFEVIIEVALLIWFICDVVIHDGKYSKNSFWVNDTRHYIIEVLIGIYFVLALIMSNLLVYSTFPAPSLTTSKRIATTWCIFRAISFVAAMGLVIQNRGNFTNMRSVIMVGFLVLWALSIYFVSLFLGGLDTEIAREMPPQHRKRKVSSVSVVTCEGTGSELECTDEQKTQQFHQFRAYLHRSSWQSAVSITGDEDDRDNVHTLAVPDCRF